MPLDEQYFSWDYRSSSEEGSPDWDDLDNDLLRPGYESGGAYNP